MQSIKDIANDLNITPQAIYKRLDNEFKESLKSHIFKQNNKTMYDDHAIERIKSLFLVENVVENVDNEDESNNKEIPYNHNKIDNYNSLIDSLNLKVDCEKERYIKGLQEQIEDLQERLDNSQELVHELSKSKDKQIEALTQSNHNLEVLLLRSHEQVARIEQKMDNNNNTGDSDIVDSEVEEVPEEQATDKEVDSNNISLFGKLKNIFK